MKKYKNTKYLIITILSLAVLLVGVNKVNAATITAVPECTIKAVGDSKTPADGLKIECKIKSGDVSLIDGISLYNVTLNKTDTQTQSEPKDGYNIYTFNITDNIVPLKNYIFKARSYKDNLYSKYTDYFNGTVTYPATVKDVSYEATTTSDANVSLTIKDVYSGAYIEIYKNSVSDGNLINKITLRNISDENEITYTCTETLEIGTKYIFKIYNYVTDAKIKSTGVEYTYSMEKPLKPSFTLTRDGANGVIIKTVAKGPHSYIKIYNKTTGNSVKTNKEKYVWTSLKENKNYKFEVVSCYKKDSKSTEICSDPVSSSITTKKPTLTASLTSVTKNNFNKLNINYKVSGTVTGVQIKNVTTGKTKTISNQKTYTWTNLTYNKSYKFKIRSYYKTSTGQYYYSAWSSIKSNTVKLPAPNSTKIYAYTKKATMRYEVSGSVTGVQIKNITTGKTRTISNQKTYTWTSLKSKKNYKFEVRSYYKTGKKTYYSNWTLFKTVKVK